MAAYPREIVNNLIWTPSSNEPTLWPEKREGVNPLNRGSFTIQLAFASRSGKGFGIFIALFLF